MFLKNPKGIPTPTFMNSAGDVIEKPTEDDKIVSFGYTLSELSLVGINLFREIFPDVTKISRFQMLGIDIPETGHSGLDTCKIYQLIHQAIIDLKK